MDEWFTERVIYDLRADSAWVERAADGYLLHAIFRTQRVRHTEGASSTDPATGARFDVVVRGHGDSIVHRGTVVATPSGARLSLPLSALPQSVEIDPWIRRLDTDRSNNRRRVDSGN